MFILGLGVWFVVFSPLILLSKLDLETNTSPQYRNIEISSHNNISPKIYSCNEIFGEHQLVRNGTCLHHHLLQWRACEISGPVWINVSRIEGSRGGEPVEQVLGRPEAEEQLRFPMGSLLVSEASSFVPSGFVDTVDAHMKRFLQSAIVADAGSSPLLVDSPSTGITLLVRRGNYANPCMAILTLYNVYIVLGHYYDYFRDPSPELTILWLDGHALGDLDPVWHELFGTKPQHLKELGLSLGGQGLNSIADDTLSGAVVALSTHVFLVNTMSAIGDEGLGFYNWNTQQADNAECLKNSTLLHFRDFVLERYQLQRATIHSRKVTILARQNYRAHPRSSGLTDRTLADVQADTAHVRSMYPDHTVSVVSFEGMPFRQQLEYMVSTDVFVAVHGAGNIHVLFLPDHATLVEYVPKPFRQRKRFRYLAECLNLTYVSKPAWVEGTQHSSSIRSGHEALRNKALIQVRLRPTK
jgi:glycoprotein 2-beta-D-xylosyltransferase